MKKVLLVLAAAMPLLCFSDQPKGKLAILTPIDQTTAVSGRGQSATVLEAADRMMPELAKDSGHGHSLKWEVQIVDYKDVKEAETDVFGQGEKIVPRKSTLKTLAKKLGVDYVVYCTVHEFTGYTSLGHFYGIGDHTGGRTNLTATVFDSSSGKLVWQSSEKAVSSGSVGTSISHRMDRSFYDALHKAVDPFFIDGKVTDVKSSSSGTVATIKKVIGDGKSVLLDIGASSDIAVGDELTSLDGKTKIKITKILDNGSLADVTDGAASEGEVFQTSDSI